jgi:hypothetical protein
MSSKKEFMALVKRHNEAKAAARPYSILTSDEQAQIQRTCSSWLRDQIKPTSLMNKNDKGEWAIYS